MPMDVSFIAGPQTYGDGTKGTPRMDRSGAQVAVEGGGKWQELTRLGQMFTGSTAAAGVNIPIHTSTTQQFVLSNPLSNKKYAVLKSCYAGYVSGAPVIGFFDYVVQTVFTNAAPTGTAGTIVNNLLGGPTSSMSILTAATVVAGTLLRPFISVYTTTAGQPGLFLKDDIDGSIIVPPGGWIALAANAATFGTHACSFEWAELPSAWCS